MILWKTHEMEEEWSKCLAEASVKIFSDPKESIFKEEAEV